MKKLILMLIIAFATVFSAEGQADSNIIWTVFHQVPEKLDFTPDYKYIITWTNAIDILDANNGFILFSIPIDGKAVGDYNYNKQYLVFAKDSTPKLLDWQTKEVVEGFQKAKENIGRIRTAKSRNEFMANTFHEDEDFGDIIGNTIYFYNIDNKTRVDSISFVKQFEKGGFKWKKTIHDYDYCGNNDEFIYIEIDDVNDEIENIPPSERQRNYYVNFYDRETKELLDSVFVFQNTDKFYGGVNKLVVMNDRSKIAWNNKDGQINFYNIITTTFEKTLKLDFKGEVDEMKFSNFEDKFYISRPAPSKYLEIYGFNNLALEKQYIFLKHLISNRIAFNNDNTLIAFNGIDTLARGIVGLFSVNGSKLGVEDVSYNFVLQPNPSSQTVNISFQFVTPKGFQLTLFDVSGNKISTIDKGFSQHYIFNYDISNLSIGTYFIRLEIGNKVITKKFIKE